MESLGRIGNHQCQVSQWWLIWQSVTIHKENMKIKPEFIILKIVFIFIIILNLSLASWAAFNVLLELKKNLTELPKCNLLYSSIISQASIKSITVTSDNSHQQT